MPLDLDPLEQRLVGVLIEKEMTVPESYPLTVNALVVGANQKSNRDPHMDAQDYQIEGALKSLLAKGWALELEREGGRTRRYAHQAETYLSVGKSELAILAELLLRGPQAPGELKTRAERMTPVGASEDVERRLRELAARPVPYVRVLERRAREHAPRWTHLLGPRQDERGAAEPQAARVALSPSAGSSSAATSPSPSAPRIHPPAPPALAPADSGLRDLVETLEQRVLDMERRLDRLEGR